MKLQFKIQAYQSQAVAAVTECFTGQGYATPWQYRIDPGKAAFAQIKLQEEELVGFKNTALTLTLDRILANIQNVQKRQKLTVSKSLDDFHTYAKNDYRSVPESYKAAASKICPLHLDIEMETGTGKTYCYIKTIFELHTLYGWSKFIVVVPSIAIREGVRKAFEITAEHFLEMYAKKARVMVYNSKQLHDIESFSSDANINVMIINTQAFNATGKDNRRIYEALDDFQSRKPINVISANRPILILDEPQKMGGDKTLNALASFCPLMVLRYSATHKVEHNKIHRLDALDAYNQKLVKKIGVRGIAVKGLAGANAYLYLESIEISSAAPVARMELEIKQASGNIKAVTRRLKQGDNLFDMSNKLEQYRGYVVSEIDARTDTVEFINGQNITAGEAVGDVYESILRRIQIRETIRAHLYKEKQLYPLGIKVLSLFFIDEVAKYRDYSQENYMGEYARLFEEEYNAQVADFFDNELPIGNEEYRAFLGNISASNTHNGYFSIDKKSKHFVDPSVSQRGEGKGLSDDVDAYDLILKDKESLLSFPMPSDDIATQQKREVRFIFSHSALREGWDNPNVFVICMLKHSDNIVSRRQEVGRGLRLCVNQQGERMDNPATSHNLNILTVVVNESYKDFVTNLQREMIEELSVRPSVVNEAYFTGKIIQTESKEVEISSEHAKDIEFYLIQNGYIDRDRQIIENYHTAKATGTLAALPPELAPYTTAIFALIDAVYSEGQLPSIDNDRTPKPNPRNANFDKKAFQTLWNAINKKSVYCVDFESDELIEKAIHALNTELHVAPLQYVIQTGLQQENISEEQLKEGSSFTLATSTTHTHISPIHSDIRYDVLGKLTEATKLTRTSLARILKGIHATIFQLFGQNPEHFIAESTRLINEQKASCIIERIRYDCLAQSYETNVFTENQVRCDLNKVGKKLKKHVYDYVITESQKERDFVEELDSDTSVEVYAKLPRGFFIPTPVGNYNPDWAIAFKEGNVKHIYFVAETKGSLTGMELRKIEETKINCARKFFAELNCKIDYNHIKYDVVTDYGKLMEIVGVRV